MTMLAQRKRLWIFTFDGTLVPAADRAKARLRPPIRLLLEELAATPRHLVAILSSRPLDDLAPRVPIPGIYLGGGCGAEWHTPGNDSMTLSGRPKELLMERRTALLPLVAELTALAGIEVDDRRWSMAVAGKGATPKTRKACADRLEELFGDGPAARFRQGAVVEIPFLPEISMEFGVRAICRLLAFTGEVICAGSAPSDAAALDWVTRRGGRALCIGKRPLVPGAIAVADLRALQRTVRSIAGIEADTPARLPVFRPEPERVTDVSETDAVRAGCGGCR